MQALDVLSSHIFTRQNISTFLGYSSIAAWLGAQVPQLVENYKRGSVEGLALPFLISWFFGDLTNLVGCILTRQLPFQTYLATYFLTVDVGLISQYIYYSRKNPAPQIPPLSHNYPHVHGHTPRHSYLRSSRSETWTSSRVKSHKRRSKSGEYAGRTKNSSAGTEDPMERSWMSQSSAATHSPASARPKTEPSHSRKPSQPDSASSIAEPTSPVLHERGRTLTRPALPRPPSRQIFGNTLLETISGSPASGSPAPDHQRFSLASHGLPDGRHPDNRRTSSHSVSRSRPPTSRRSTGIALLSIGLLATFGRWSNAGLGVDGSMGRAWSVDVGASAADAVANMDFKWPSLQHPAFFHAPVISRPISSQRVRRQIATLDEEGDDPTPPRGDPEDKPHRPRRDWERFIGRASAWFCTALYLTSRLPQIWQNFRRRSVEGLSMLLFIMAFIGNSLYVLSILTHPSLSSPGYLLESTPYLLGSGGTLCFDITIVLQSVLYSDVRKARKERDKRRSSRYGVDAEEAAALLQENATETEEDDEGTAGYRSRSQSHGGRSRSSRPPSSRKRGDSFILAESPIDVDPFEDRPFDFDSLPSRSQSRSRTLSASTTEAPGSIVERIDEEGESSVTIRP